MRKAIFTSVFVFMLSVSVVWAGERGSSMKTVVFDGNGSYLGVDTRDITEDRLGPLHLKEEHGVEVTMVDQDAPAGKAGIKEHDVILSINGQQVESVEQLRRMIRELPPGRAVNIGISRDGQLVTLNAQLASRKQNFVFNNGKEFHFNMPHIPQIPNINIQDFDVPSVVVVHTSARSGLMVENLTPQLGDFFGAKNGQGVLVRSVEKGSRAEKAGFHAGDVVVRVNGEAINDTGDFNRVVRARKETTVKVSIIREKKEQTLTLTLPERKQSNMFGGSFELPDIEVETNINLRDLDAKLAHLKPELEKAMKRAQKSLEKVEDSFCQDDEEKQEQKKELDNQEQAPKPSSEVK